MRRYIEATLLLSAMIIGVGMFGIPFSFAKAGFWLGTLELVVLTGIILLFHLLYGEIVLQTSTFHRLPGYVRIHLGKSASLVSWFSALFGISGTLLAYVVLSALFLNNLFQSAWSGSSEFFWAFAVVAATALITFFPLRREPVINGILTAFLILFVIALIIFLSPHVELANVTGFHVREAIVPYGILLFALSGGVVIPDLITLLGRDRRRVRSAIALGTIIPAVLYFFFAFVVVGALGSAVSEEAIAGLAAIGGEWIVLLGSIIGFLAAFTSLVVLSTSFQALFQLDFGFSRIPSWFAVSLIPLILYLLGFQDFIVIIGAVGAIAVGLDSALVIAAYHKMRDREGTRHSLFTYGWQVGLFLLVGVGVVYELYRLFVA